MSTFKTEVRVIELTKLAKIPHQVDAIRIHLQEIIHGEAFSGSPRSQQFLHFVVQQSIDGKFESLKERMIGVELFHLPPTYDTGENAIVRVTATDVRKRLLQHYGVNGNGSEYRINILRGSYIPEITWIPRAVPFPYPHSEPLPELDRPNSRESVAEPQRNPESPTRTKSILFSIPIALLFLALSFWAGYQSRKPMAPRASIAVLPWSVILGAGHTLQIVASDPDFATLQDVTKHAISLSDYANEKYFPDNSTLSPELRNFCVKYLRGTRAADVDLPIVAKISLLTAPTEQRTIIHTARAMRTADFRTDDDFILLGSPIANPWMDLFSRQLDFKFAYINDAGPADEDIENVHPRGNEPKVYTPLSNGFENNPRAAVSYAIIGFIKVPRQSGYALILAGTSAPATSAAAQMALNISDLPNVLRNCSGPSNESLQEFELLLKVNELAGSATSTDVITCHRLHSQ